MGERGREGRARTAREKGEKSGKPSGESANIAEDEDGVWMAAMDDSSDADDEGELVGCFGEEDNKDFWFTDDSSEDEDDLYSDYKVPEKSVNVEEEYDSMPELIPDYDDSEDDNSEVGDFSREFLDGEGDRLVEDLGEDAFTRTFTCAMLANTGRIVEGVETELYDSRASL